MTTKLLMGNEAAAQGALAAGAALICGYPGTPSSELLETAAQLVRTAVAAGHLPPHQAPHVEWSVNEKAAVELAFGASMSGARSLVTMKQMGLNVASDAVMTIAYLGVKGGLVLYVADDPGPISSQTEQDTRQFAQFAKLPVLDPSTPEELYQLIPLAFELSERHGTAVIVRPTTRICHGSAPVALQDAWHTRSAEGFERDPRWIIFPSLAYQAHLALPHKLADIAADPAFAALTELVPAADKHAPGLGLVASGISWAYLLDALSQLGLKDHYDLLRIGAAFPFNDEPAAAFLEAHAQVLVFEELEATVERELLRIAGARQLQRRILGKLTGHTACAGENSVALIAEQLESLLRKHTEVGGTARNTPPSSDVKPLPCSPSLDVKPLPRPPLLCAGCPHRASLYAVKKAMRGRKATFSGDIGCYTLGNALPLDALDSCVCMGAGFTVPQGRYWAEPEVRHLGFVGDSTFFASGITGVINAVYNQAPVTLIVLDNATTAMTGTQPHPGTGMRMSHDASPADARGALSIPRVLKALGVAHVAVADPFNLEESLAAVQTAVAVEGVSALVFQAPCITVGKRKQAPSVLEDRCNGCRACMVSIGCPALSFNGERGIIAINDELCFGCRLCAQVCRFGALA